MNGWYLAICIGVILLDFVAIILLSVENVYLFGIEKLKYFLLILFVPIVGALIVMYKFGGKGKSPSDVGGGNNAEFPPSYSSGGDSGGGGY